MADQSPTDELFTDRYSYANAKQIAAQCPHATVVLPLTEWNDRGRMVRKGEKALLVWVPKEGPDRDSTNPEARHTYFRQGKVFDISQTRPIAEWEAETGKAWNVRTIGPRKGKRRA